MKKKPSSKQSPKKPVAKAAPPFAVGTPAKPEKPATGNPAHKATSPPALWVDLANTAKQLVEFYRSGVPAPIDYARLRETIQDCFRLLFEAARCGDATGATSLFNATRLGCEFLTELSKHETTREMLRAAASPVGDFPMLLSRNPKSFKAAKEYLDLLSVGIKMKYDPESRYRELAAKFIKDIRVFQPMLKLQAMNWKSSSPREQRWHDKRLPDANKYPEILDLPKELNANTCAAWRKVVEKMFDAYWHADTVKAEAHFNNKQRAANTDSPPKSLKSYVKAQVLKAFERQAAKGSQRVESIP